MFGCLGLVKEYPADLHTLFTELRLQFRLQGVSNAPEFASPRTLTLLGNTLRQLGRDAEAVSVGMEVDKAHEERKGRTLVSLS